MKKNEIIIQYGHEISAMTRNIIAKAGLADMIGEKEKKIGIKPNLVNATPAGNGATTHPEIAEEIIRYLQENGFKNITILEGSGIGKSTARAFAACGYDKIIQKYGVDCIDTQKDEYEIRQKEEDTFEISRRALDMDFLINLPVMKGHCQTRVTCALKNYKGLISNAEKRSFHAQGLHRPIALLNTQIRCDFILVDAICGDLDYEEGGSPVDTGMLYAAVDRVLCDSFAADRLGYRIEDIPYISQAARAGVGSMDLAAAEIIELNEGRKGSLAQKPAGKAEKFARYTQTDSACSICYSALIRALSRLPEKKLRAISAPICIGQGFAGKDGKVGVGRCTGGFDISVRGCPPSASEILAVLEGL